MEVAAYSISDVKKKAGSFLRYRPRLLLLKWRLAVEFRYKKNGDTQPLTGRPMQ